MLDKEMAYFMMETPDSTPTYTPSPILSPTLSPTPSSTPPSTACSTPPPSPPPTPPLLLHSPISFPPCKRAGPLFRAPCQREHNDRYNMKYGFPVVPPSNHCCEILAQQDVHEITGNTARPLRRNIEHDGYIEYCTSGRFVVSDSRKTRRYSGVSGTASGCGAELRFTNATLFFAIQDAVNSSDSDSGYNDGLCNTVLRRMHGYFYNGATVKRIIKVTDCIVELVGRTRRPPPSLRHARALSL